MTEGENTSTGVDVLHPLACLHSVRCYSWRKIVWPIDCVLLQDIVAILVRSVGPDSVYISTNDLSSWTSTTLPYNYMSLSTYQDQLVAVGGCCSTGAPTNVLLTSSNGCDWQSTLPAMPSKRYKTSTVSAKYPTAILVVAGGCGLLHKDLDFVEVLLGNQWNTVPSLPTAHSLMRSTLYAGRIYFAPEAGQNRTMYTCTCESLCAAHDDRTSTGVWTEVQVPHDTETIASCTSRLVSIDGDRVIRGCSNGHWIEMTVGGDWEYWDYRYITVTSMAAAELLTGVLVVAKYDGVFTLILSVGTFDPDSRFISNVFSRLEAVLGLMIIPALARIYQQLTTSSGVILEPRRDMFGRRLSLPDPQTAPGQYVEEVALQWSTGHSSRPPIWKELLDVLKEVGQLDLRQQIEVFMKGTRYRRRMDLKGHIANHIETKLVVKCGSHVVSYVIARDPVPIYWSQPECKYRLLPVIEKKDDTSSPSESRLTPYERIVKKIPVEKQIKLQQQLRSEKHLRKLAEKLTGWDEKYDLFHLDRHGVNRIKRGVNRDNVVLQQIEVLHAWKDECSPDDTYDCLLQVLIEGKFGDCITEMLTILCED